MLQNRFKLRLWDPVLNKGAIWTYWRGAYRDTGKDEGATVVIQTKQHLAAVIADEEKLTLNTLRYGNEIRDAAGFEFPGKETGLKPAELKMAEQLIESMRGEWRPEYYRDTYRDDVMARIQAKIKAGETHMVPTAEGGEQPRSAEVIDLMSLLKNSIPGAGSAASKRGSSGAGKATKSKPAAAQRKRA